MKQNAFEVFGLLPSFEIDLNALEKTYYRLSKEWHPDKFARENKTLLLQKQSKSAELNTAYKTLLSPENRLDHLLELAGHRAEEMKSTNKDIPMDLAEEYFELQEIEDAAELKMKTDAFISKLEKKLESVKAEISAMALNSKWNELIPLQINKPHSELSKMIEALGFKSYLLSMIGNAKKMISL